MTPATTPSITALRESDETAWLEQTAALVTQGRINEINARELGEYLLEMARRDKREVMSRLSVLLAHLLKWEHQAGGRSPSWQATIAHQRNELRDLLDSRTLENHAREILELAYQRARKEAALEMQVDKDALAATCPWSLEEIMLEE